MTETPDFDQIAIEITDASYGVPGRSRIAAALRLAWNARDTADKQALYDEWREGLDLAPVVRVLTSLDR